MPIKTGFWIRVQNGLVTDCWDYKPDDTKLSNENGWIEAIEVSPDIIANREIITTHTFNIDKVPAEIVWSKRNVEIEERKESLKAIAKQKFFVVVREELHKEVDEFSETQYNQNIVDVARIEFQTSMNLINSASTHEDVDKLMGV